MGYLTPSFIPTDTICRVLLIPNGEQYLANVYGAIEALTFAGNYSQYGLLTPLEAAQANMPMFDALCFNQGVCRVIGEIIAYAGPVSPDPNWLICDGSSLLRSDYNDLFTVIGTTYGAVDSTHFSIPDLRDRVAASAGSQAIGTYYGEAEHTLTNSEVPSHSHTESAAGPNATTIGPGAPQPTAVPIPGVTGASGGGGAHNNIQPTLAVTYLIVASQ
jgi:microcystin-dependent protein